MLEENTNAPELYLKNQNGKIVKLSNFAGKPLIVYFYPQDDTPGCTTEACNFRDDYSEYENLGVEVIGISPDTVDSHKDFKKKYLLPFTLLSDPNHQAAMDYEVWGKKEKEGKEYEGIHRTTFIIDGNGKIIKIFEGVDPSTHSIEVLEELKKLI